MHNPESVLENETHKLPRDFELQTDHLITARRPDQSSVETIQTTILKSARILRGVLEI